MSEKNSFREGLPAIGYKSTRLVLVDARITNRSSAMQQPSMIATRRAAFVKALGCQKSQSTYGGNLVYDQGDPLSEPLFQGIQARTFDPWDLQTLLETVSEPCCSAVLCSE